ncbi:MAG: hypothetical protein WC325_06790 [Candidatus Bathyarchaeia archaeon]
MATTGVKEFVDDLRTDWKDLWQNRVEDKVRAEGIAKKDYSKLFVERGTVIKATRDFKPIEFFDIVEAYLGIDADKTVPVNSTIGGWGKFVKENIKKQNPQTKRTYTPTKQKPAKGQHQKNGGRGWLNAKL